MKKKLLGVSLLVMAGLFAGCGNTADSGAEKEVVDLQMSTGTSAENTEETGAAVSETGEASAENQETAEAAASDTEASDGEIAVSEDSASEDSAAAEAGDFSMLAGHTFEFCSGAGGWGTELFISADGSFEGDFHDSEMGSTGEGYENGTIYISNFTGHFTDLTKIDDYTYEMKLGDISYSATPGTEEIGTEEQIKYIYSTAYGLTDTETYKVYLPGKPVSEISEETASWLTMVNGDSDTLTMICIENVDQQEGIYSY